MSDAYRTRSEQLRARHRRILGWSIAAAAALHVLVFQLRPEYRTPFAPESDNDSTEVLGDRMTSPVQVAVVFGPPRISTDDGSEWTEPPERVLHADRVVELPRDCAGRDGPMSLEGSVRLLVRRSGNVDHVRVHESTGDACADAMLETVAGALLYEWLPNERFAAPVDLVQPMTMVEDTR